MILLGWQYYAKQINGRVSLLFIIQCCQIIKVVDDRLHYIPALPTRWLLAADGCPIMS